MRMSERCRPVAVLLCAAALAGAGASARAQAPGQPPKSAEAPAAKTAAPAGAAAQAALPGGATALQETHGDWQVRCVVEAAAKRCEVTQEQVNQQDKRRVLIIQLNAVDDRIAGAMMLPFGLALDNGVALQIDDLPTAPPVHFKTCLPGGCLVPLAFDGRAAATLRAATALKAKVVTADGQEATFTISLKGLASALERIGALQK